MYVQYSLDNEICQCKLYFLYIIDGVVYYVNFYSFQNDRFLYLTVDELTIFYSVTAQSMQMKL